MRKSDTRCESKQECSSSKADELKVEFSAEWLRIWRYERGISHRQYNVESLRQYYFGKPYVGVSKVTPKTVVTLDKVRSENISECKAIS